MSARRIAASAALVFLAIALFRWAWEIAHPQ